LLALSWTFIVVPIHVIATRMLYYLVPVIPLWALCLVFLIAHLPFKKLILGLLLSLCVLLFMLNNYSHLKSLDHSPGIKTLAARAARSADHLFTYNLYHTAAAFYAQRQVTLLTDSRSAYQMLTAWPIFRRSGTIRLLGSRDWGPILLRPRTAILTEEHLLPRLLEWVPKRGLTRLPSRQWRHSGHVLIVIGTQTNR
jgi:hypothetical protein